MTARQAWLTVMSNREDSTLSGIRSTFYSAPVVDSYLHLTPWTNADRLFDVVTNSVLTEIDNHTDALYRIDIVGHAHLDGDDDTHGFDMKSDKKITFGLVGGHIVGADCLTQLLSAATTNVEVRLILCQGSTLPDTLLSQLLQLVQGAKGQRPKATLWHTAAGGVDIADFDAGGFNNAAKLMQYPAPTGKLAPAVNVPLPAAKGTPNQRPA